MKKIISASRKTAKTAGAVKDEAPPLSINDWHEAAAGEQDYPIVPPVECVDGFTMSVQASQGHYCSPRQSRAWPYSQFEIGYPSKKEQLITKYAESPGEWTQTVYGFVPVEVVAAVIAKHGGIKQAAASADAVEEQGFDGNPAKELES